LSPAAGTIARAALVLLIFNILSKLTALVREVVIARQFGATAEMDAYLVAFSIPSVLFFLFTGALATVVVPVYSEYAARGREQEAWGLFGTFFNALLVILILTTAAGLLCAPWLVKLLAPGFQETSVSLAVELTRLMFPLLIFSGLASLFGGLLNARNIFAVTALNAPLSNIAVIVAVLTLSGFLGVHGMALGVLAGGVAAALVQLPALRRAGFRFRPGVPFNHPDLKKIFRLLLPITVGLSISQTYILIDRFLGSGLAAGSISALNYANRLIQMPVGLFATALGTAVFPSLTRRAAGKDLRGLGEGVRRALRLIILVCVPASVVLLVLREPLVVLFFERGAFDARATGMTAAALFFYSFGLVGWAGEFVLARGFFSLQDTRTPVKISAVAVTVNLALSLALIGPMQHSGLALANSTAALTNMTLLLIYLNRRVAGLWDLAMGRFIATVLLAAGVMGAAVHMLLPRVEAAVSAGTLLLALQVSLATAAGMAVYAVVLALLRVEEVRSLWGILKNMLPISFR